VTTRGPGDRADDDEVFAGDGLRITVPRSQEPEMPSPAIPQRGKLLLVGGSETTEILVRRLREIVASTGVSSPLLVSSRDLECGRSSVLLDAAQLVALPTLAVPLEVARSPKRRRRRRGGRK
jgi:hypothetical protein